MYYYKINSSYFLYTLLIRNNKYGNNLSDIFLNKLKNAEANIKNNGNYLIFSSERKIKLFDYNEIISYFNILVKCIKYDRKFELSTDFVIIKSITKSKEYDFGKMELIEKPKERFLYNIYYDFEETNDDFLDYIKNNKYNIRFYIQAILNIDINDIMVFNIPFFTNFDFSIFENKDFFNEIFEEVTYKDYKVYKVENAFK